VGEVFYLESYAKNGKGSIVKNKILPIKKVNKTFRIKDTNLKALHDFVAKFENKTLTKMSDSEMINNAIELYVKKTKI
jgi:hypothetical protein